MATAPETFHHSVSDAIRTHAMSFPETEEGTSCVNRAFKAGGKNFVFLGEKDETCTMRLKLDTSVPELTELASADPARYEVGTGGWTKLVFRGDDPPPISDIERWITESFHLLAPKKVQALLD
ncbi:MAG: MmcQ/YjbR family DNA-binding protein [Acidimicrobiales bacterium]